MKFAPRENLLTGMECKYEIDKFTSLLHVKDENDFEARNRLIYFIILMPSSNPQMTISVSVPVS